MIWIVLIVMSLVMFKLGVLTVVVSLLSIGLKLALLVIIAAAFLCLLRWYRYRRGLV